MKLIRIEKGTYNKSLRRGLKIPYIYLQPTGLVRFSASFVQEFNIQGEEHFDFFTDEQGGRFFFKIHDAGVFTIQKHHRKRKKANGQEQDNDEYVSQSVAFRYAILKKFPSINNKAAKLVSIGFNEEASAYELDLLPAFRNKRKDE